MNDKYVWSKLLPHCTQLAKCIFWYEHCFLNQNYWQRLLKYITPVLSGRKLNNKWNLHLINGDIARVDGETANSRAWHLPIVYKPSRECQLISFVSGNIVLKQMQLWQLFGGSWLLTFILMRVYLQVYSQQFCTRIPIWWAFGWNGEGADAVSDVSD